MSSERTLLAETRLENDPTPEELDYISRWGGMCRGCADEDGICPSSGLPCEDEPRNRAIRHVVAALRYGQGHGYLKPSPS